MFYKTVFYKIWKIFFFVYTFYYLKVIFILFFYWNFFFLTLVMLGFWKSCLQDGRIEGCVLIFLGENSNITAHCWATVNRRMLGLTKNIYLT